MILEAVIQSEVSPLANRMMQHAHSARQWQDVFANVG
jgi:hypothetical protein